MKNTRTKIWNFFASVKLSIFLLIAISLGAIIGTLIPQNQNLSIYLHSYGELGFKIFYFLGFFDLYKSAWFQILLFLLFVNLIVCSFDRLPNIFRFVFKKSILKKFEKNQITFKVKNQENIENHIKEFIEKKYSKPICQNEGDKSLFYGEKGKWTILGPWIVHLSIALLLIGVFIDAIFGFNANVNINEGGSKNFVRISKSNEKKELGFDIVCKDFEIEYYKTGEPKEYRSIIKIIDNGKEVLTKKLLVNHPISYKGIRIFQSSYGSIPDIGKNIKLALESHESLITYNLSAKLNQRMKLPEKKGFITLKDYIDQYNFRGMNIGSAIIATIEKENNEKEDIILSVSFPTFDRMRPKQDFFISIKNFEKKYYTGLQVNKSPAVWLIYFSFALMLIGLYISFFMTQKKIFICLDKKQLTISLDRRKNKMKTEEDLKKVKKHFRDLCTNANF